MPLIRTIHNKSKHICRLGTHKFQIFFYSLNAYSRAFDLNTFITFFMWLTFPFNFDLIIEHILKSFERVLIEWVNIPQIYYSQVSIWKPFIVYYEMVLETYLEYTLILREKLNVTKKRLPSKRKQMIQFLESFLFCLVTICYLKLKLVNGT